MGGDRERETERTGACEFGAVVRWERVKSGGTVGEGN